MDTQIRDFAWCDKKKGQVSPQNTKKRKEKIMAKWPQVETPLDGLGRWPRYRLHSPGMLLVKVLGGTDNQMMEGSCIYSRNERVSLQQD